MPSARRTCVSLPVTASRRLLPRYRRRRFIERPASTTSKLDQGRMRFGQGFPEDDAGVGAQRPCHARDEANSREELDLDSIALDETERTLELKPARRVVDDLCALKGLAAMNERVRLDGRSQIAAAR
jgi:hypothetical protein